MFSFSLLQWISVDTPCTELADDREVKGYLAGPTNALHDLPNFLGHFVRNLSHPDSLTASHLCAQEAPGYAIMPSVCSPSSTMLSKESALPSWVRNCSPECSCWYFQKVDLSAGQSHFINQLWLNFHVNIVSVLLNLPINEMLKRWSFTPPQRSVWESCRPAFSIPDQNLV